jgi:hypothetical protein
VCVSVILAGATPAGMRAAILRYSFALRACAAIGRKVTKFGRYYTCFCSTSGHSMHALVTTELAFHPPLMQINKRLGVN